jgi:oligoribonuclease
MATDANHLVWIDLEMTGLEPDRHVIIEIATLITNADLEVLAEGPVLAIHQDDAALGEMDAWNQKTHGGSGLLERVAASTLDAAAAEAQTLAFVREWTPAGASPLCGNTIGQDRRFLRREMPELERHFHYRSIDVSTIKELAKRWYPPRLQAPPKQERHRALDDIRESIAELRWYREHLFIAPPAAEEPSGEATEDASDTRAGEPGGGSAG